MFFPSIGKAKARLCLALRALARLTSHFAGRFRGKIWKYILSLAAKNFRLRRKWLFGGLRFRDRRFIGEEKRDDKVTE